MMATHSAAPGKPSPASHGRPSRPGKHGGISNRLLVIVLVAAGVVAVAISVAIMALRPSPTAEASATPEAFVEQMERAAGGTAFDRTVYGGPMRVERKGNQIVITAIGVPPAVCVSVGWKLVRKGLLSINGVTPVRVSAAKLSELCNQDTESATLTWAPKEME
ncbi:hypothetical protein [Magnetospirillum sp. SS-4]|uniref:hypothetical protein n=1 Tax=Magnetospirillum sp. SS-4 TaxID=2681465 RepID=UPI00138136D8|nr:hypothetical protein [Magnetospirillum sp. SS-4]CAA7613839.1 conserved hypothetical protein [Magnetospirillum sp. SS-4]